MLKSLARDLAEARGLRYVINHETGCWEWFGTLAFGGYAISAPASFRNASGTKLVHRYHYWLKTGELPNCLDHLCRVRHCVNPDHLEPTTPGENIRRGANAKVTWEKVTQIREASARGELNKDIAEQFGVAACTISQIRHNRTWKEEHRPS